MARLILAQVLKKKKLSKRQFSIRLKVTYPTVFKFFKPNYNPSLRAMERWAKAIGCRVRDLFEE